MSEAPRLAPAPKERGNLDLLGTVSVRLSVEVGSTSMMLAELAKLDIGSIVTLDRQVNEPLDICANGTRIARGEMVSVDGQYGIRITELVPANHQLQGFEQRA